MNVYASEGAFSSNYSLTGTATPIPVICSSHQDVPPVWTQGAFVRGYINDVNIINDNVAILIMLILIISIISSSRIQGLCLCIKSFIPKRVNANFRHVLM